MTMGRWERCTTLLTRETQVRKSWYMAVVMILPPAAQGTISRLVSSLFQIDHDYFGTMMSNLAKVSHRRWQSRDTVNSRHISVQLHMAGATEESNEKHLGPWSSACHRDNISNTPLSPYMDQELLYNRSALRITSSLCHRSS